MRRFDSSNTQLGRRFQVVLQPADPLRQVITFNTRPTGITAGAGTRFAKDYSKVDPHYGHLFVRYELIVTDSS